MKRLSIVLTILLFLYYKGFSQNVKTEVYSLPWTNSKNEKKNEARKKLIPCLSNDNLVFKGGLVLYSRSNKTNKYDFGGLSALHCFDNGRTIMTVSDYSLEEKLAKQTQFKSKWFQFTLEYDDEQTLVGAKGMVKGQVHDLNSLIIRGEIESMAYLGDSIVYVGFDNLNYLLSYDLKKSGFGCAVDKLSVDDKQCFPARKNAGIEALTNVGDSLFAIYEVKGNDNDYYEAWLIDSGGKNTERLRYNGFVNVSDTYMNNSSILKEVKGATTLQNGDIVILEKLFKRLIRQIVFVSYSSILRK
ncbi:esterase-like activity of phytase family protein [Maribellus maritimus]|uniref:esterase-like activity of phytase family protein n=1 Tax=Maribellus maritimus TaxID=2870838 RepID=UPI001EEB6641|nr:esterase-like activity of phytase family protein [Maribellus maritimus]MCG6186842.1 esterase-like activity of phytase family protein [Maribellus maritimus]